VPEENLKDVEDEHPMLTLPFLSLILKFLHLPHHELLTVQHQKETTCRGTEAINPLPKSSVEGKQRDRKPQKSEILPGTLYKNFSDSKEEASKVKGKS
jgi:hypothetical protein